MLLNLHKKNWTEGLRLKDWQQMKASNEESIKVRILVPPTLHQPYLRSFISSFFHSACFNSPKPTQSRCKKRRP